jgi:hypothetical protein
MYQRLKKHRQRSDFPLAVDLYVVENRVEEVVDPQRCLRRYLSSQETRSYRLMEGEVSPG